MPHQADGEEFQASVHNIWVSPPFGQQETRMEQTGYPFAGAICPTTEHSSNQQDCNPNFYAAGGSYTPSNGNQTLEHSCLDPSTMADAGYTHLPDYLSQSSCSGEDDFAPIIGSSNLGFSFTRLGPHDENRVVNPMQGSSMSSGTPQGSHLFPECDRACPMPQFSESLQELEDVDLTPRNPSDEPWHPHQSADTGTISREHPSFNHVPGFYPGYAPARSLPSEMEPSAQVLTSGNPANRSPRSMFLYPMARYTPSEEGDISDFRVMLGYHGAISTPTTANSGIWLVKLNRVSKRVLTSKGPQTANSTCDNRWKYPSHLHRPRPLSARPLLALQILCRA